MMLPNTDSTTKHRTQKRREGEAFPNGSYSDVALLTTGDSAS